MESQGAWASTKKEWLSLRGFTVAIMWNITIAVLFMLAQGVSTTLWGRPLVSMTLPAQAQVAKGKNG